MADTKLVVDLGILFLLRLDGRSRSSHHVLPRDLGVHFLGDEAVFNHLVDIFLLVRKVGLDFECVLRFWLLASHVHAA